MREHWRKRAARAKIHRIDTRMAMLQIGAQGQFQLPAVVLLTRIAPRELDDDNLRGALKAVRDGVADWLGVDDRDKRVRWEYGQAKGGVKQYAVGVEISSHGVAPALAFEAALELMP